MVKAALPPFIFEPVNVFERKPRCSAFIPFPSSVCGTLMEKNPSALVTVPILLPGIVTVVPASFFLCAESFTIPVMTVRLSSGSVIARAAFIPQKRNIII